MKLNSLPNLNHVWSHLIVEELIRNGADYFCLSPGSRSSPLTVAVAQNKKAKSIMHFDERGAAFHALGYTSATKHPSVLISTSGTAGANYFPAIIEASKKKLPLIVLTADRPPELRFTGADQTIDQVKMFGEYVRFFFDMPCPDTKIKPEMVLTTIDQAVHKAKNQTKGPVHINCMFREPLAPTKTQENFSAYLKNLETWEERNQPQTAYVKTDNTIFQKKREEIAERLSKIKKGIIVVGKLGSKEEQEYVLKLASKLNWPVFPDITSGLRLSVKSNHVVPYYDLMLLSEKLRTDIEPDGVLHLGGRITSKRWYEFIDSIQVSEYIMVNSHPLRNDPHHNVTTRIQSDVLTFCDSIIDSVNPKNNLIETETLKTVSDQVDHKIKTFLSKELSLTEPTVARIISKSIQEDQGLFLASSMPIRELDMYANPSHESVVIGSNRGASGIDGTIASAIGFATGINKPTTLLIGDLAFLHDINSLAMLRNLKVPFVIVVVNNDGGGIFHFLPIAEYKDIFEEYFGTPHNLNFKNVAKMFNLNYEAPNSVKIFSRSYKKALAENTPTLIEVTTDRNLNHKIHLDLQNSICSIVNRSFDKERSLI